MLYFIRIYGTVVKYAYDNIVIIRRIYFVVIISLFCNLITQKWCFLIKISKNNKIMQ